MKATALYFSPTGGTKRVAEIIAAALSTDYKTVDLCEKNFAGAAIQSDELAIIAVPSFYGRVPRLCADRLRMISGNGAMAIPVAVYGNRDFEDTLVELTDILTECGFRSVAAISAIAQHSIANTIAANRPDAHDAAELQRFAVKIQEKIASGDRSMPAIPGNRPYRDIPEGSVPIETIGCCECGTCAPLCPSGAISMEHPSVIDTQLCIGCMRCVAVCPVQARSLPAAVVNQVTMMLRKACPTPKQPQLFL